MPYIRTGTICRSGYEVGHDAVNILLWFCLLLLSKLLSFPSLSLILYLQASGFAKAMKVNQSLYRPGVA